MQLQRSTYWYITSTAKLNKLIRIVFSDLKVYFIQKTIVSKDDELFLSSNLTEWCHLTIPHLVG